MSLVESIPLLGPFLASAIPFIVVLGVVVFVHELGHYLVGRWCGIGAETFSVGFGPELLGWTDRRGTRWRVAALPLGGYVKFVGDDDPASATSRPTTRPDSFDAATVGRRVLTVLAGPLANMILSIVIFAMMAFSAGAPDEAPVIGGIGDAAGAELGRNLAPGDRVLSVDGAAVDSFGDLVVRFSEARDRPVEILFEREGVRRSVTTSVDAAARVDALSPGGAAARAGLAPGDLIVEVDGDPIRSFSGLQRQVLASDGAEMALLVERNGETLRFMLTPDMTESVDPLSGATVSKPMIGVVRAQLPLLPRMASVGPLRALEVGFDRNWAIITGTWDGVRRMISGADDAREAMGGPIRIAQLSGEAAEAGPAVFLTLLAVISTSIGLLNLLPVPVLDGGHLLFFLYEAVVGKPAPDRVREFGAGIGLALVLALMLFATFNDISRL